MIDFTNLPRRNKTYGGANGSKRSVIYQDEQYIISDYSALNAQIGFPQVPYLLRADFSLHFRVRPGTGT